MENRLAVRNVHLYEASTGRPLGGFYQAGSITESNLHDMLYNVLLIIEDQQLLTITYQASGQIITPSNNMVEPGDYVIASNGKAFLYMLSHVRLTQYDLGTIIVTDEPWVERISSHSNSSRTQSFRDGVQNRDGRCVVSGVLNANAPGWWIGFQAAHVFPLEHVSYWVRGNFAQWITDMDGIVSEAKINSVQNGLLMSSTLHSCFDNYMFSINPDVCISKLTLPFHLRLYYLCKLTLSRTDIKLSRLRKISGG